jgi:HlyD family secretion protein
MSSFGRAVVFGSLLALGARSNAPAQDQKAEKDGGKKGIDVASKVEGQSTISLLKPPGSCVKNGDLVVELDGSELKDRLVNQEIATRNAEAAYQNARLSREVAEIAVEEYKIGIFQQDLQTIEGEIALALARSDRERAKDRLEWTKEMMAKGYISLSNITSERLALKKPRFIEETNGTKKVVHEKYTKSKTIKELQRELEKLRSDELAKKAMWKLEVVREHALREQVDNLRVVAPADGRVEYVFPIAADDVFHQGDVHFRLILDRTPNAAAK